MSNDLRAELDALFTAKADREEKAKQATLQREAAAATFVEQFNTLRNEVIRPAFEEIVNLLAERGVTARISESDDNASESARITIRIQSNEEPGRYRQGEFPHFSAICSKTSRKVNFHESTMTPSRGGHAGGAGEATIEETTKELIQQKVMKVIKEVIR
ncbi:hypothetical protein ACF8MD_12400 [Pseudomonas sp. zjy_8]